MHSTKASSVYAGYARRRVPTQAAAQRRLLARGEVAFAKQMTERALRKYPLSRLRRQLSQRESQAPSVGLAADSSPINGGAFGAAILNLQKKSLQRETLNLRQIEKQTVSRETSITHHLSHAAHAQQKAMKRC